MAEFTIITPVLNQVSTIEKCIESVSVQNVDTQHIIIDGGSTDGTLDIIQKHEDKIAFWISERDNGQCHAINKGLKRSRGTWFNWLNADDQLTQNALEKVLETAQADTQVVVGRCQHIDSSGNEITTGGAQIWHSLEATLANYSMGQPSVFYRTEVVKKLNGLNESLDLCMDMDLWFRFLLDSGQQHIATSDKILSNFLVRPNSKSTTSAHQMKEEKYSIYHALMISFPLPEIIKRFFSDYPIPEAVSYAMPSHLNGNEILSHFAHHLMAEAYAKRSYPLCKSYLDVVKNGNRLSSGKLIEWKARIAAAKLLRA